MHVILVLIEMLICPELAEKSKEHVQAFDLRFVIRQVVHWDVQDRTNDAGVVSCVHVNLWTRESNIF